MDEISLGRISILTHYNWNSTKNVNYQLSRREICIVNFLPPAKKGHPLLIKSQNSGWPWWPSKKEPTALEY